MKHALSLCFKKSGQKDYWSPVSYRYSYYSLRRAFQAKNEWQKYWNKCYIDRETKPIVRIEHYYPKNHELYITTE